ncbi:hypothetical protein [Qipengyuania atrilutea]|uniref:Uncharacterized protein n=1 Tax=Qipengyuania atrilutea TaxID=2744473 RepID=A0A850H5W4_9SPHN|nr:hypothetical protein [Actirhodobacter atriluteus]NVD44535.1 hypothetical protein [Actirhodobacter atriluteus]
MSTALQIQPDTYGVLGPSLATLRGRWEAVEVAADALAELAQLGTHDIEIAREKEPDFGALHGAPHADLIAQAVADLAAMMQPGLRALIAIASEGRRADAAAATLWHEYAEARAAIAELCNR